LILVDTNIFLELLLDQKRADECEKFLNKLSRGELEGVVTRYTIHAIETMLNSPDEILLFLRNVENSIGLYVYETDNEDEMAIAMLMKEIKRDFDDTLQYYVAKKLGAKAIVSFDRHFDGLDIPRAEPKDYI